MPYFAYIEAYETGAYSRISVTGVVGSREVLAPRKKAGEESLTLPQHTRLLFILLLFYATEPNIWKGAKRLVLIFACAILFLIFLSLSSVVFCMLAYTN